LRQRGSSLMSVATPLLRYSPRLGCLIAVSCVLGPRIAAAFPATDDLNPGITADLPAPTESDLRHQLQLQSGGFGAAANGGGWTFTPALGAYEFYTDNVLATATNRRWDLVTVVTPSLSIFGDEPNVQVNFSYSPQFRLDATTPQENSVNQQLAGTGLFTVIPDEVFLDVRAFAGVAPLQTGLGAQGATLNPTFTQTGTGPTGLSQQQLSQDSSVSISPYVLHRFGDTGTAKVGYEINETSIAPSGSGIPLFFPSGSNSQHSLTNEAVAQFETGERFAPFRNLLSLNVARSSGTGIANDQSQDTISNQLGYVVNRDWEVYGQLGYEKLNFGGVPPTRVDDMTWGFGAVWTPNADSQITLGYGHVNGVSGVQLSAYYALTARTRITASYTTGLQTNLGQIQGQLDLQALNQNGQAVDALTGAPQFNGINGFGNQNGLYQSKNFNASISTSLDRDQLAFTLALSQQTTIATATQVIPGQFNAIAPPVGSTGQSATAYLTWSHQLNEDLSLNSSAAYGTNTITAPTGIGTGQQRSVAANVGLQYALSQTVVTSVQYTFYEQFSPLPGQTIYQNVFLVGINKQF
jgi:uncharacterized protein (PEP-CTERM system associated)